MTKARTRPQVGKWESEQVGGEGVRCFPHCPAFPLSHLWFLVLLWSLAAWLNGPLRAQEPLSEHQVKAVWLLNFARFVEWPESAFAGPNDPIVVGVAGKDPFGAGLEKVFSGKTVKGRSFRIRQVSTDQEMRGCHLLFVVSSDRRKPRDWAEKLKRAPVLTVGETEEFLGDGGIINFVLKDSSVRFEINLKAAQAAGLRLDANLLKVAVSVRGKYD